MWFHTPSINSHVKSILVELFPRSLFLTARGHTGVLSSRRRDNNSNDTAPRQPPPSLSSKKKRVGHCSDVNRVQIAAGRNNRRRGQMAKTRWRQVENRGSAGFGRCTRTEQRGIDSPHCPGRCNNGIDDFPSSSLTSPSKKLPGRLAVLCP